MKNITLFILFISSYILGIDYYSEIQPIFNANCTGCHNIYASSYNNHQLDLESYTGLMQGGESGDVVTPGDSTASILFQELSTGSMPPYGSNSSLTIDQISLIASWIAEGALENEELSNSNHEIPSKYNLSNPYPNPFNPSTSISFTIPENIHVSLIVYDGMANHVSTLFNKLMKAGKYDIDWTPTKKQASGVYFIKLNAGDFSQTQKLVFVK